MTKTAPHYLLLYDVADDFIAKRASFRSEHVALAHQAHDRGELLLAGALSDPADGAVLVFAGPSREPAETFARADPYVTHGLVTRWRVREWATLVWDAASADRSR